MLAQGEEPEKQKPKGASQPAKKEIVATVDMLDIRVGQIVSVSRHPDADALYVEEIDIGEEQPRQVTAARLPAGLSGIALVEYIPPPLHESCTSPGPD